MPRASTFFIIVITGLVSGVFPGCSASGPAKRNIDVVYRFENLRTPTSAADARSGGGPDEWSPVKGVLDRASAKPVKVNRFGVRTLGNIEVANYEARCVLPSLVEFSTVQADRR